MNSQNKAELESIYEDEATFWCRDADDLPTPNQLQSAIAARKSGVLLFAGDLSELENSRALEAVQRALPLACVEGIAPGYGFDRVRFRRILTRDEIISHADELMRAAREFTDLANDLCAQLAAKVGISTTQLSLCGQYLPPEKRTEQIGFLTPDWRYFFHGFECGFEHRQSGQHLDVIFGFRDEFGVIEAWFWQMFIESTPRFSELSNWLALGAHDVQTAMKVLLEVGLLFEIDGSPDFVFEVAGRRGCIVARAV